jgi:hypothetical protein
LPLLGDIVEVLKERDKATAHEAMQIKKQNPQQCVTLASEVIPGSALLTFLNQPHSVFGALCLPPLQVLARAFLPSAVRIGYILMSPKSHHFMTLQCLLLLLRKDFKVVLLSVTSSH